MAATPTTESTGDVQLTIGLVAHEEPSEAQRITPSEPSNRGTITETTRMCPGCAANVEKHGKCNEMDCSACGEKFCWICLQTLAASDVAGHYAETNWRGCGGARNDDVGARTRPTPWRRVQSAYLFCMLGLIRAICRYIGFVVYPLAFVIAHLMAFVGRAFSIQSISSVEFPILLRTTADCCALSVFAGATAAGVFQIHPTGLAVAIYLVVLLPFYMLSSRFFTFRRAEISE